VQRDYFDIADMFDNDNVRVYREKSLKIPKR
jgi:hypothetical protein